MKFVDCFLFYNELDMLLYRLTLLDKHVDMFVLVESAHTFMGNPKALFYAENREKFATFSHKIVHVVVDDFPHISPNCVAERGDQWTNETFQRKAIDRGIQQLEQAGTLKSGDKMLVCDVDEIPDPASLADALARPEPLLVLEQDCYYYNCTTKMEAKWYLPKLVSYDYYVGEGRRNCAAIRGYLFAGMPSVSNGGWHLSYFGDMEFIRNKIAQFSHQEYNTAEYTSPEQIERAINENADMFRRNDVSFRHIALCDNPYLPPDHARFFSKN